MVGSAPLWTVPLVPVVIGAFAVLAVLGDAALTSRAAGRPLSIGALGRPLRELPRLLVAQPRSTPASDRLLGRAGVITIAVAGLLAAVVIPYGPVQVSPSGVGVVWFNAMEVLSWAGVWMAGWGANSVLSLVGGYRFLAQGLAYELPLMFALISAAAGAQSLSVVRIADAQQHLWFVVWMPIAFFSYLVGVYAFSFLGPFAYPSGADLAGGVLGELSGVDLLLVQAGRWLLLTAGAAMAVPLFLGAGHGPLLPSWAWSTVKTLIVLGALVWARQRLPLLRADRYVELAWVVLLPATVLQSLVPALVDLTR